MGKLSDKGQRREGKVRLFSTRPVFAQVGPMCFEFDWKVCNCLMLEFHLALKNRLDVNYFSLLYKMTTEMDEPFGPKSSFYPKLFKKNKIIGST